MDAASLTQQVPDLKIEKLEATSGEEWWGSTHKVMLPFMLMSAVGRVAPHSLGVGEGVQNCQLVGAKCGGTCVCVPLLSVLVCLIAKGSIFVPISSKKWIIRSFRNKIKGTPTLQCQARKKL